MYCRFCETGMYASCTYKRTVKFSTAIRLRRPAPCILTMMDHPRANTPGPPARTGSLPAAFPELPRAVLSCTSAAMLGKTGECHPHRKPELRSCRRIFPARHCFATAGACRHRRLNHRWSKCTCTTRSSSRQIRLSKCELTPTPATLRPLPIPEQNTSARRRPSGPRNRSA